MENKEAEGGAQKKAAASCFRRTAVGEEATLMDRVRQFKDALAAEHWACLKNKVRAAGEYAGLRTRQGISMFGEPKIGSAVKEAGARDDFNKMSSSAE